MYGWINLVMRWNGCEVVNDFGSRVLLVWMVLLCHIRFQVSGVMRLEGCYVCRQGWRDMASLSWFVNCAMILLMAGKGVAGGVCRNLSPNLIKSVLQIMQNSFKKVKIFQHQRSVPNFRHTLKILPQSLLCNTPVQVQVK